MKKRVRIYKAGGQKGQYINPTAKWMMQMGSQEQGQDEQIMIAVQQAILQGSEPNDVYDNLVSQGLPSTKVAQIVQIVLDNIDDLEEEAYAEESGDQDAAIELAQREAEEMQAQSQNQFNDMMQGAPSVNDMIMEDDDDYDDSEFEDDLYDLQRGGIPKRDEFIKQVKKQYGGKVKQGQKPEDVSTQHAFNFLDKVKQSNEQALLEKQLEQQAGDYYDNVMLPEAQRGREVRRARRQQRQLNRGINKIMRNTPVGFMGPGMLPQNIGVINPFGMPQTMPQGNVQGFPGLQMANIEVHKTGLFGRPKQYSMTFNYNTPDPIKEAQDVATSTAQSITDEESRKQQEGKPSDKEAAQELETEIDNTVSKDSKQKKGSDNRKKEISLENTESGQENAYVRSNPLLDPKYWRDDNSQSNPLAEFLYGGSLPKAQKGYEGKEDYIEKMQESNAASGIYKSYEDLAKEYENYNQNYQQNQRQYYSQQYPGYRGNMQYSYGTGYGNIPTMFNPYGRRPIIQRNPYAWMQQKGVATDAQGNPVANPQALPLTRFAVTKSGLFGKPRRWEAEFGDYNQSAAQPQRPEKVVTQQDLDRASGISTEDQDNYQPSSFGEKLMLSNNRLLSRIGSKMTPITSQIPKEVTVDQLPLRPYSNNDLYTTDDLRTPSIVPYVNQLPVRSYSNDRLYTMDDLRIPKSPVISSMPPSSPLATELDDNISNTEKALWEGKQNFMRGITQSQLNLKNQKRQFQTAGEFNINNQELLEPRPDYVIPMNGIDYMFSGVNDSLMIDDPFDPNEPAPELEGYPQGYKTKGKFKNQFDVDFGAAWDMANYGARTILGNLSEEEKKRQHYARMMGMQTGVDSVNRFRGNYATNQVAAAPNFRDPQAGQMMYSQQGGQFNIGDEVEMTDEEIAKFVAGGGKLKYV